jgi:hypothetical protein
MKNEGPKGAGCTRDELVVEMQNSDWWRTCRVYCPFALHYRGHTSDNVLSVSSMVCLILVASRRSASVPGVIDSFGVTVLIAKRLEQFQRLPYYYVLLIYFHPMD